MSEKIIIISNTFKKIETVLIIRLNNHGKVKNLHATIRCKYFTKVGNNFYKHVKFEVIVKKMKA